MIKDIRFFPKERNTKIFEVIVQMLIDREIVKEESNNNIVKVLDESFDQITQSTAYSKGAVKFRIKFVSEKVSTINKINGLLSYIENNQETLTFILVEEIFLKPFEQIMEYPNTEIFWIVELLRNPIKHIYFPKMRLLNSTEKQAFLEEYDLKLKDIPRMEKVDFVSRYFHLKCGDIIEIIRPSLASGESVFYRVVVNCSWSKLF
jgi:DNA-directed RNA polymerase subunit H (RpoH/RPB5)